MEELLERDDIPEDVKAEIRRGLATREEAAAKLRRERDAAEDLIAVAPVVFLVLDRSGRIVRYNRHLEQLTERALAQTRGEDWFHTFLPERDQVRIRRVFLQTIDDIPTSYTINNVTTADGREVPIEWLNRPLKDGEGNTVGVLSIGRDLPG
ncbi:MAG: PAS domain S-box protein [Armatimonadetes bacterium]|nr:PAS domain S-box protein [Armatimonadota bacterium]